MSVTNPLASTALRLVKALGPVHFSQVVDLILEERLRIDALNIDGKGDGGSDRYQLRLSKDKSTLSVQVTVQQSNWFDKALGDAKNAVTTYGTTNFLYFTSVERDPVDLRDLEMRIRAENGIAATCLGARELAGLIVKAKLLPRVFAGLDNSLPSLEPEAVSIRDQALSAFIALGDDAHEFKQQTYDDTLLLVLYRAKNGIQQEELIGQAKEILGATDAIHTALERRIGALFGQGKIVKADETVHLGDEAAVAVEAANQLYRVELEELQERVSSIISGAGGEPSRESLLSLSVFLSRAFVHRQLQDAKDVGLSLHDSPLVRAIGDPVQDIRDKLVSQGVKPRQVDRVTLEIVNAGEGSGLVKRLTRSALYVAIESAKPIVGIQALGASSWADVSVFLDASVAIPYLCAKLFSPTKGRFSRSATAAVDTFIDLGADVCIAHFHLQECASHLLRALQYEASNIDQFSAELASSQNGFVAQYWALRQAGKSVPDSVSEFLAVFASSARFRDADKERWTRTVRSELQPMYMRYSVRYESVPHVPQLLRDDIEREYVHTLNETGRKKARILIEDDVSILAHMRRLSRHESRSVMCLTWDGAMIKVAKELDGLGWVVGPEIATDLARAEVPTDEAELVSLSHSLASSISRPEEAAARFLDRVVYRAAEHIQDWEFIRRVKEYKEQMLTRVDLRDPGYRNAIDTETDRFLAAEGVGGKGKGKAKDESEASLDTVED